MSHELMKNLANNLKALRLASGKTLDEFSEELCIARSTLQELEAGRSNSRMDTVQIIADKLELPAIVLLSPSFEQLTPALFLFRQLESFLELSPKEQKEVTEAFHTIIRLLTKSD